MVDNGTAGIGNAGTVVVRFEDGLVDRREPAMIACRRKGDLMSGRGRSYILFVAGLAAIVAGFWPRFFGNPLGNDAWHILHGVAATLWVLLLITQSFLIGRGNRRWHERLGWLSLGPFATLLATTGYMI